LSRRPCPEICSHCSRKENNDNSGVTVERVELINESSTVPKVVSVSPNPDNSLTWPVKERKDESEHAEKSGSKREFREEFKDSEGTCVGVQNETLSPERCVYSTYGSDRKSLNKSYTNIEIETIAGVYENECKRENLLKIHCLIVAKLIWKIKRVIVPLKTMLDL
jgi:hypothetical protein